MFPFQSRNVSQSHSRRIRASARFRPSVAGLEERALLSSMAPDFVSVAQDLSPTTPVQVFQEQNGQLVATVTLSSRTFTVPVTPEVLAPTASVASRSLRLTIGPIDQPTMGLRVQGAPFVATITPQAGTTLGNQLIGILGQPGTPLPSQTALASGLNQLIAQARADNAQTGSSSLLALNGLSLQNSRLVATGTLAGQPFNRMVTLGTSRGTTSRVRNLTLALEPIDTNVQGLQVQSASIPLTVSAQPGRRNPLGTALGQFTNVLARNPNRAARQLGQLTRLLSQI